MTPVLVAFVVDFIALPLQHHYDMVTLSLRQCCNCWLQSKHWLIL